MAESVIHLIARGPEHKKRDFVLDSDTRWLLGRDVACHLQLNDRRISRRHCEVWYDGRHWQIQDEGSSNGTQVNGSKIDSAVLRHSDRIRVGSWELTVNALPDRPGVRARKKPKSTPTIHDSKILDALEPSSGVSAGAIQPLKALYKATSGMMRAETFPDLLECLLEALFSGTEAKGGTIALLDQSGNLKPVSDRGRVAEMSHSLAEMALKQRAPLLVSDLEGGLGSPTTTSLEGMGITSAICVPLLANEKPLGVIQLYISDPNVTLDEGDLNLAMALAAQTAVAIERLNYRNNLERGIDNLRELVSAETEWVGESLAIKQVQEALRRASQVNTTVLVRGESGTGKELAARWLHFGSPRRNGPFICLNCAAISDTLLESELFGHEKGSFTGATERKIGKFEAAHSGTIFLDEIGEMNEASQAKVLRILEGHPFERVGGNVSILVDVRVLAATHCDLEEAAREGRFRKDLFYRLRVIEIALPALRERGDDVMLLADHFLRFYCEQVGRRLEGFTEAAVRLISDYQWPGNVRELKNAIERAVVMARGSWIEPEDLGLVQGLPVRASAPVLNDDDEFPTLAEMERRLILEALRKTGGKRQEAAELLGLHRSTLYRRMQDYGLPLLDGSADETLTDEY